MPGRSAAHPFLISSPLPCHFPRVSGAYFSQGDDDRKLAVNFKVGVHLSIQDMLTRELSTVGIFL